MLSLLQLQTRVIFTGHPKISKILCNHISWCKRWTLNPFPCSCSCIAPLLNITLSASKPHISTLGHDTTSKFDHVLHSNLNDVCVPNIQSFPEQFLTSFLGFYDQVNFFTKTFMELITHVTLSPSQHLFKNKAFDRIYSIFSTFNTPPKFVLTLISQLDQYATSFIITPYSPSPYISEVNCVAKTLGPRLVLSAPDRNSGIPDLYCPSILWQDMFSSFWENRNFKNKHMFLQSLFFSHFKYIYDKMGGLILEFFQCMGLFRIGILFASSKIYLGKETLFRIFITH